MGAIRFEGNEELNTDQFLAVIRTRETPWAVQKWIYNRFDKEILFGKKPEYFDPITFVSDYQQIKKYYEDNGFFHAKVDTSIVVHPDKNKVFLTFSIVEGRRSLIDTILFLGLENLSSDIQEELSSNKQIIVGMPYIQTKVEAEYKRIVGLCANNGYVNVKLVTVGAQRYASTDNISLVFVFDTGKRFTFGNISVEQDTTSQQYIDTTVVFEHLDFSTGEFYGEEKKIESERNLNRLGVFEAAKIENAIPNNSSEISQIPIRIHVRTRPFQEFTPEVGINDENNAFNVLFGIGYNHRNFFGGARNFSTNLRLNVQSLQFGTIFKGNALKDSSLVSKIEWTTQITQPYFINNKTSISAAVSAILDKQSTYYIPSLSFRLGTQSQTATYTRLFIDWSLQLSDPKTEAPLQYTSTFFRDKGFEKQFNSFVTVTLQRDKRNDIFYPSEGIVQSISLEEGGFVPRVLEVTLPYAQYVKALLTGQWYWNPDKKQDLIWAVRLRTGAALLYGVAPLNVIPLTQRFYSGGSGSVRGWQARALGAPSMTTTEREQGSNALVEGNIEARINPWSTGSIGFIDLQKISFVLFYDFGNLWSAPQLMRLNEIAMAFGFGLRYNTIAGPIRIDFGMKMYNPDPNEGWVSSKRFFPETFNQGIIHLGVGHTF
ncbi:MAG: BamA/TamA family outer membrane protein [Ignavibacteriales bacterium]|nr:BamA/TamA family outer membrane protein [Ignavibacteriales bacterium]